jgi:hypothetical protein
LQEIETKNAETFDKIIISLSTASLGFSIAFLDKIVPYDKADYLWLLVLSWGTLSTTITLNIISIFVACGECKKLKKYAKQFYFNFDDIYLDNLINFKSKTMRLNVASAILYVLSICIIVVFVSINIL